jgi:hypothetical protein
MPGLGTMEVNLPIQVKIVDGQSVRIAVLTVDSQGTAPGY